MNLVPTVIEQSGQGERAYDIYSRLLKDRIIMVSGEINDDMANAIIAQLLFLDAQDSEKDMTLLEVFQNYFKELKKPVIYNFESGHSEPMLTLPSFKTFNSFVIFFILFSYFELESISMKFSYVSLL